jgi:ribosomal protein S18 acetylase RimI-like enzyme
MILVCSSGGDLTSLSVVAGRNLPAAVFCHLGDVTRRRDPTMEIVRLPFTHPDVVSLVDEVQAEYVRRYGGPDETPLEPAMFEPPAGAFFVGYRDGWPVAMGGWRFRADVCAFGASPVTEIKRMYVAPRVRRSGLARHLLEHLEASARDAGSAAMVLETGLEQPEAIALYQGHGYTDVEAFGHYRWSAKSRYYGKVLGRSVTRSG